MKVYDTFLFGDELDMLQCRLEELDGKVYQHVLVEAAVDHQGNPKPLYYAENKERFAAWSDRITHVVAELPAKGAVMDPWEREHIQREHVWAGIDGADPDDLVLVCDVDEIPSDRALTIRPGTLAALSMRLAMFAVDWVYPEETRVSIAALKGNLGHPLWWCRDNGPRSRMELVEGCGWHFTWLGGPDAIRRKAQQFCHLELQRMILTANDRRDLYEQGFTWHGMPGYPPLFPGNRMVAATVDETWPKYIRERRCPQEWFRPGTRIWDD